MGFSEQKVLFGMISLPSAEEVEGPVLVESTSDYQTYLEERNGLIWQKRVYANGFVEQSDNGISGPDFNANGGWQLPGGRRVLWQYSVATQEQQA